MVGRRGRALPSSGQKKEVMKDYPLAIPRPRFYHGSGLIFAFINRHNDQDTFRGTGTDEIFGPCGHGSAVPLQKEAYSSNRRPVGARRCRAHLESIRAPLRDTRGYGSPCPWRCRPSRRIKNPQMPISRGNAFHVYTIMQKSVRSKTNPIKKRNSSTGHRAELL